ncbi:MAG: NAD(+)/NADH kinase [bacterium]
MNCIGVICKPDLDHVEMRTLDRYLSERKLTVLYDETAGEQAVCKRSEMISRAELLIVLGGDGTILNAARSVIGHDIPILGVNLGRLGFLAEFSPADLYLYLDEILAGNYNLDHRIMLKAEVFRNQEPVAEYCALNELILHKEAIARVICLRTTINGDFLNNFSSDGIIVATPTGSTAYSLSAGGPIVQPGMEALVIAPICPHTLSNRPLVVPDSSVVEVTLIRSLSKVYLTMDGQEGKEIYPGDLIKIRKTKDRISLVCHPRIDYYTMLREKLGWGVSSSNGSRDSLSVK